LGAGARGAAGAPVGEEGEVGGPAVEAVENVGAVHHGRPVHPRVLPSQALTPAPRGATCLGRAHRARPSASYLEEKEEEVAAGDDVQIGRRLVEQTQVMWSHQLQHELDPPPLPFRHGPDSPVFLPGAPRALRRPGAAACRARRVCVGLGRTCTPSSASRRRPRRSASARSSSAVLPSCRPRPPNALWRVRQEREGH
jgi:hypothetical protein